jgi:hypothetical protein
MDGRTDGRTDGKICSNKQKVLKIMVFHFEEKIKKIFFTKILENGKISQKRYLEIMTFDCVPGVLIIFGVFRKFQDIF